MLKTGSRLKIFDLNSLFQAGIPRNSELKTHTRDLLDLLDKYKFKATFFVLGWIADRLPDLVAEIYSRGHEIASHGYSHQLNSKMSKEEIVTDIVKSKTILENIIDRDVIGYRAPCFFGK